MILFYLSERHENSKLGVEKVCSMSPFSRNAGIKALGVYEDESVPIHSVSYDHLIGLPPLSVPLIISIPANRECT